MASMRINGTIETGHGKIYKYVTSYYNNLFTRSPTTKGNGVIDEVIPHIINDNINNMLTLIPSHDEIKVAVFNLNKYSSLGSYGFVDFFYKSIRPLFVWVFAMLSLNSSTTTEFFLT